MWKWLSKALFSDYLTNNLASGIVQFITGQNVVNQGRKLLQIVAAWEKIIAFVAKSEQFKISSKHLKVAS